MKFTTRSQDSTFTKAGLATEYNTGTASVRYGSGYITVASTLIPYILQLHIYSLPTPDIASALDLIPTPDTGIQLPTPSSRVHASAYSLEEQDKKPGVGSWKVINQLVGLQLQGFNKNQNSTTITGMTLSL